jgi:hypothetical protein
MHIFWSFTYLLNFLFPILPVRDVSWLRRAELPAARKGRVVWFVRRRPPHPSLRKEARSGLVKRTGQAAGFRLAAALSEVQIVCALREGGAWGAPFLNMEYDGSLFQNLMK